MRGLSNQCVTLLRLGRYDELRPIASRLRDECGDDLSANAHIASAALCSGDHREALDAAAWIAGARPSESLVTAFAAYELGQRDLATAHFVHALANAPWTVGIVLGKRMEQRRTYLEATDARGGWDVRSAVAGYLDDRSAASKRFFSRLWNEHAELRSEVIALQRELYGPERLPEARRLEKHDRLAELRAWTATR